MANAKPIERRRFLRKMAGGLGVAAIAPKVMAANICQSTAAQTSGPFYPGEDRFIPANDLTRVPGSVRAAKGQVIYLQGTVRDSACNPVPNVNVEIWQACASGRYNHDRDPNPAPLDPDFRYWGETFTDAEGRYEFKTIKPGAYPATDVWDRPPHIHVRISRRGYKELITQLYFKGEELNESDLILLDTPESQRPGLIVNFVENWQEPGSLIGHFHITIEKV